MHPDLVEKVLSNQMKQKAGHDHNISVFSFKEGDEGMIITSVFSVLKKVMQYSGIYMYLDNVIILGRTFREHLDYIKAVFQCIKSGGLKLRADKCSFLQENVKHLGHVVGMDGLQVDPEKVEKVASWPVPQSHKQVQQFLGFANYYRRFIQGFANVARPLHRLTKHTANYHWTTECQMAFKNPWID